MFAPLLADLRDLRRTRLRFWPSLPLVIVFGVVVSLVVGDAFRYLDRFVLLGAITGAMTIIHWSVVQIWNRSIPTAPRQPLFDLGRRLPDRSQSMKDGPCSCEWYMRTMDGAAGR